jgi:hypothetical protein
VLRYARIPPATLQIEHHPFLVQQELLNLAKEEGIAVTAYSSFGPASFLEFGFKHAEALVPLMKDDVVTALASKYGKQPSQILLRWATQRGLAVIPKTTRTEIMAQNLDCTSFDLDKEDLDKITSKDAGTRFNQPSNVSILRHCSYSCSSGNLVANCSRISSTSLPKSSGSSAKQPSSVNWIVQNTTCHRVFVSGIVSRQDKLVSRSRNVVMRVEENRQG